MSYARRIVKIIFSLAVIFNSHAFAGGPFPTGHYLIINGDWNGELNVGLRELPGSKLVLRELEFYLNEDGSIRDQQRWSAKTNIAVMHRLCSQGERFIALSGVDLSVDVSDRLVGTRPITQMQISSRLCSLVAERNPSMYTNEVLIPINDYKYKVATYTYNGKVYIVLEPSKPVTPVTVDRRTQQSQLPINTVGMGNTIINTIEKTPFVLTGVGYGMTALGDAVEHVNTDPMRATAEATLGTYVLIGAGGLVYAPIATVAAPAAATVGVVGASATTGYMLGQTVGKAASGGDLKPLADAIDQIQVPDKEAPCSERAGFLSDIHGAFCNMKGRQNWISRDCMSCCESSFDQVSSSQQIQNACPSDTDLSRSGALYESFMNQCNQKCNL